MLLVMCQKWRIIKCLKVFHLIRQVLHNIIDNKIVKDSFTYNFSHWTSAWMFPSDSNLITILIGLFHIKDFLKNIGLWCRKSSFQFWYIATNFCLCDITLRYWHTWCIGDIPLAPDICKILVYFRQKWLNIFVI